MIYFDITSAKKAIKLWSGEPSNATLKYLSEQSDISTTTLSKHHNNPESSLSTKHINRLIDVLHVEVGHKFNNKKSFNRWIMRSIIKNQDLV